MKIIYSNLIFTTHSTWIDNAVFHSFTTKDFFERLSTKHGSQSGLSPILHDSVSKTTAYTFCPRITLSNLFFKNIILSPRYPNTDSCTMGNLPTSAGQIVNNVHRDVRLSAPCVCRPCEQSHRSDILKNSIFFGE